MAMGTHWNPRKETIQEIVTLIDSIRLEIKELRQLNSTSKHCLVESTRESGQSQSSAYKMFDGMPSKNDVFFPSEIPEIQSTGLNEDVTRFNLGSQIDNQVNERTLLVKIHHEVFPISCRELDMVFSRCGILEKLEKFSTENEFHSMVCFQNKESALEAFNSFNGRNIYDEGCEMELFLGSTLAKERWVSKEAYSSGEMSRNKGFQQITAPTDSTQQVKNSMQQQLQDSHSQLECHQTPIESLQSTNEPRSEILQKNIELGIEEPVVLHLGEPNQEIKEQSYSVDGLVEFSLSDAKLNSSENWDSEIDKDTEESQSPHASLKVNSDPLEVEASDIASDKMGAFDVSVEIIEVCLGDLKVDSFDFLANQSAHQVFDCMPHIEFNISASCIQQIHKLMENWIFDPGDFDAHIEYELKLVTCSQHIGSSLMPSCEYNPWILDPKLGVVISIFDPGIISYDWICKLLSEFDPSDGSMLCVHNGSMKTLATSIFDPGIAYRTEVASSFLVQKFGGIIFDLCAGIILVFDPGGGLNYYISKGVLNFWSRRFESACVQPKTVSYMEDLVQLSSGIPNEFLNFVLGSVNLCCFPFDPGGIACPRLRVMCVLTGEWHGLLHYKFNFYLKGSTKASLIKKFTS